MMSFNKSVFEVYCDFDGTVSQGDVFDLFLHEFANPEWLEIEREWEEGKIGSKECLSRQMKCVRPLSWDQIQNFLQSIKIDPYFSDFVTFTKRENIPLRIMSDGLDLFIQTIFQHNKIPEMSIFSNKIYKNLEIFFPFYLESCEKKSGVCKCSFLHNSLLKHIRVYIGDGRSDFCVANKADIVFAKDKLLKFCLENNIPHYEFKSFQDITVKMRELIGEENAQSQKQSKTN